MELAEEQSFGFDAVETMNLVEEMTGHELEIEDSQSFSVGEAEKTVHL